MKVFIDNKEVPKTVGALSANYRHSGVQTVGTTPVPLQIDGLLAPNFNDFDWEIWNPQTSKFQPNKAGEKYLVRVSMSISATESLVVKLWLQLGQGKISPIKFQPTDLEDDENSDLMVFYVGENFVRSGATLMISASVEETEVKQASLLIIRLATMEGA